MMIEANRPKSILWFKARMPGAVRDGSSLVSLNLAECLSERFAIDLVSLRLTGREESIIPDIAPPFREVILTAPDNAGGTLRRAAFRILYTARSWIDQKPRSIYYEGGHRVAAVVKDLFKRRQYDLAVFEYFTSTLLMKHAPCPTVLLLHDATFETSNQRLSRTRGLERLSLQWHTRLLRQFEASAIAQANTAFCISEADMASFTRAGAQGNLRYLPVVLPPVPHKDTAIAQDPRICFLGNLGYDANRDGFEWFLRDVFPKVRQLRPDACLVAIGGGEDALAPAMRMTANVCFMGRVPNLAEALQSCSVGISPSLSGTGVKIKVLDMMWHGLPLVVTRRATPGTPAAHGGALIADDAERFANHLVALLDDSALRDALRQRAWQLLEERHCGAEARSAIQRAFLDIA